MRNLLAIPLLLALAASSLIDNNLVHPQAQPPLPPLPSPPEPSTFDGQPSQANVSTNPPNSLDSIKSLLANKYNSLLMNQEMLPGDTDQSDVNSLGGKGGISETIKAYQKSLLDYYRNNQPIPAVNSSRQDNIDNGENNTINGKDNVIKDGDFNSITGMSNTINGSHNQIIGHNDVVHGNGNFIMSMPPDTSAHDFISLDSPKHLQQQQQGTQNQSHPQQNLSDATNLNHSSVNKSGEASQQIILPALADPEGNITAGNKTTSERGQVFNSLSTADDKIEPAAAQTSSKKVQHNNSNTHVSTENYEKSLIVSLILILFLAACL